MLAVTVFWEVTVLKHGGQRVSGSGLGSTSKWNLFLSGSIRPFTSQPLGDFLPRDPSQEAPWHILPPLPPQLLILCSPSPLPLPKHPAKVSFPGPLCLSGAVTREQKRQLKADRVSHALASFSETPLGATHSRGGVRGWKGSESPGPPPGGKTAQVSRPVDSMGRK